MANGWDIVSIGDICESIFDGPHATPAKTMDGPIFLGISNLKDGRIDLTDAEHLSEDDFIKWTRRVTPQANDIVFSYETRLGEAALVPDSLKFCLGRRMALMRPNKNKVYPRFLLFAYLAPEFQQTIKSRTVYGSTVDRIPLIEFPNFPIAIPPLPEQRAIADVLGALDDKIELIRRMNATLEAMAQALFKEWFVKNEEAKGWEVKPLDQIANFLNGLALQKYPAEGDDYLPVIKIAQLHKSNTEKADKASTSIPDAYIVNDGDVLFSWSGSLEVIIWCGGKGALNQHLFKVTSGEYPKWFYYQWIRFHLPEFQQIAAGKATTMGHIQRHHLSAAEVIVPGEIEMSKMDEIMRPTIDRMIANNLEARTLASLRDALLPRLMRGEVRVNV